MAVVDTIICEKCQLSKVVCYAANKARPTICYDCEKKVLKDKKNEYLRNLQDFFTGQRINILEEKMYDLEEKLKDLPNRENLDI